MASVPVAVKPSTRARRTTTAETGPASLSCGRMTDFLRNGGKAFTPKIAAALLKDGKAKVKGLRSMKTGKTYDGTVLLADTGGKYVNYRIERRDNSEIARIGSVATLPANP